MYLLYVPVIGTCSVSKITLVLGKNDPRQADNSGFSGVNHPCLVRENTHLWTSEAHDHVFVYTLSDSQGRGAVTTMIMQMLPSGISSMEIQHALSPQSLVTTPTPTIYTLESETS